MSKFYFNIYDSNFPYLEFLDFSFMKNKTGPRLQHHDIPSSRGKMESS